MSQVTNDIYFISIGAQPRHVPFGEHFDSAAHVGLLEIDEDFHDCGIMGM